MALVEIKKSDYQQGPLQLAIGPNSQLLAYIQEYGEQSFRQLLGLYYDDAVANDRQKYTDLFNGTQYTDEHGEFNSFVGQGLAYVVRRFIYFYFLRDTQTINSDTGTVIVSPVGVSKTASVASGSSTYESDRESPTSRGVSNSRAVRAPKRCPIRRG